MYSVRRHGQMIRLIDTPGFDDSRRDDLEILTEITYWLNQAYIVKLHLGGIVYLHPIHEPRLGGVARRNLTMFKLLCGKDSLSSVVLATTMWSKVEQAEGEKRQEQLEQTDEFWGDMLRQGSTVTRHHNSVESAWKVIDGILESNRKPMVLDIQKEMIDQHKDLQDTGAGQEQMKKFLAEKAKAERRLQASQAKQNQVLRDQEQADAQSILEDQARYQETIKEQAAKIAGMKQNADSLSKEKEAQWEQEREEFAKSRKIVEERSERVSQQLENLIKAHAETNKRAEDLEAELKRVSERASPELERRNKAALEEVARLKDLEEARRRLEQTSSELSTAEEVKRLTMRVEEALQMVQQKGAGQVALYRAQDTDEEIDRGQEIEQLRYRTVAARRQAMQEAVERANLQSSLELMKTQRKELQHAEMLRSTKKGVNFGFVGAAASVAAVAMSLGCSVM